MRHCICREKFDIPAQCRKRCPQLVRCEADEFRLHIIDLPLFRHVLEYRNRTRERLARKKWRDEEDNGESAIVFSDDTQVTGWIGPEHGLFSKADRNGILVSRQPFVVAEIEHVLRKTPDRLALLEIHQAKRRGIEIDDQSFLIDRHDAALDVLKDRAIDRILFLEFLRPTSNFLLQVRVGFLQSGREIGDHSIEHFHFISGRNATTETPSTRTQCRYLLRKLSQRTGERTGKRNTQNKGGAEEPTAKTEQPDRQLADTCKCGVCRHLDHEPPPDGRERPIGHESVPPLSVPRTLCSFAALHRFRKRKCVIRLKRYVPKIFDKDLFIAGAHEPIQLLPTQPSDDDLRLVVCGCCGKKVLKKCGRVIAKRQCAEHCPVLCANRRIHVVTDPSSKSINMRQKDGCGRRFAWSITRHARSRSLQTIRIEDADAENIDLLQA